MRINIEIYKEGDLHCAYIGDDCGGSGIEVAERDYERFAEEVGAYIADYAFREDEEEDDYEEDE